MPLSAPVPRCESCPPSPVPCRLRCGPARARMDVLVEIAPEDARALVALLDHCLERRWTEQFGDRPAPKQPPLKLVPR